MRRGGSCCICAGGSGGITWLLLIAALICCATASVEVDERLMREGARAALRHLKEVHPAGPRRQPAIQTVLAFVSPWHRTPGYDLAVKFAGRAITHVAPAWFDVESLADASRRTEGTNASGDNAVQSESSGDGAATEKKQLRGFVVRGDAEHFNSSFASAVAAAGALLVPKVRIALGVRQLTRLLQYPSEQRRLLDALRPVFTAHNDVFGGFVIDCPNMQLTAPGQRGRVVALVGTLRDGIARVLGRTPHITFVLPADADLAGRAAATWLAPLVDAVAVMTFDFNRTPQPGPLAPIRWVEDIALKTLAPAFGDVPQRLLVGVPLFGYSYDASGEASHVRPAPITAHEFAALLATAARRTDTSREADDEADDEEDGGDSSGDGGPRGGVRRGALQWDVETMEHVLQVGATRAVHYPTRAFVAARLSLAARGGLGVALWELGQGADAHLQLL